MRFQEEFQYITDQNSTAVYTNVNKWKHTDITWHARRGSKCKLFTARKLDKIGDGLSHSPQNILKYFANNTMILKMSQDSWYVPHKTTAGSQHIIQKLALQ